MVELSSQVEHVLYLDGSLGAKTMTILFIYAAVCYVYLLLIWAGISYFFNSGQPNLTSLFVLPLVGTALIWLLGGPAIMHRIVLYPIHLLSLL